VFSNIAGTWSLDPTSRVIGSNTETLNGYPFVCSFVGRATTGKRLVVKAVAPHGTSTMSGIPATTTPDIANFWAAVVRQQGLAGDTLESFILSHVSGVPGFFTFTGNGGTPGGYQFVPQGAVTITSKGRAAVFLESDFYDGTSTLSSLVGRFNTAKRTARLSGKDFLREHVNAKLTVWPPNP